MQTKTHTSELYCTLRSTDKAVVTGSFRTNSCVYIFILFLHCFVWTPPRILSQHTVRHLYNTVKCYFTRSMPQEHVVNINVYYELLYTSIVFILKPTK